MSKRLKQIADYVTTNWVTDTGHRPRIYQFDTDTALLHCDGAGVLAVTSARTDLGYILSQIPTQIKSVPLFYGDRETFFRSARDELVKKGEFTDRTGSLWQYNSDNIAHGLLLTDAEKKMVATGSIHYFHPAPAMTQDVIGTYGMKRFVFDYTRHANYPDGKPMRVGSKRYFFWDAQQFTLGTFGLEKGQFVERKPKPLELQL